MGECVSATLYKAVSKGFENAVERIITLAEERDKAIARIPKWFRVNEYMLPVDVDVLLCGRDGTIEVGRLGRDGHLGSPCIEEVTHWMPLPEPPKGADK